MSQIKLDIPVQNNVKHDVALGSSKCDLRAASVPPAGRLADRRTLRPSPTLTGPPAHPHGGAVRRELNMGGTHVAGLWTSTREPGFP